MEEVRVPDNIKKQIVMQEITQIKADMYRVQLRFKAQKKLAELSDNDGAIKRNIERLEQDMERLIATVEIYEDELKAIEEGGDAEDSSPAD